MNNEGRYIKFMRILLFFDLPTHTKENKKSYIAFRKLLLQNGFDMIQFSVYTKICNNPENADKYVNRIIKQLPCEGNIRSLLITDKQYMSMKMLLGEYRNNEKMNKKILKGQISIF